MSSQRRENGAQIRELQIRHIQGVETPQETRADEESR